MRKILAASAFAILASPAFAGDFTGGYIGAQIGNADITSNTNTNGSGNTYGLHLGYDYDNGDWVFGGELEMDRANITLGGGAATVSNIARVKAKIGYDIGQVFGYVVAGGARASTTLGNDTGYVYGVGLTIIATYDWNVSFELLRNEFTDVDGAGTNFKANTANLRVSYRF